MNPIPTDRIHFRYKYHLTPGCTYVRGEFKNKCDSSNISVQSRLANKLDKI
jgi:hypothetical protein